MNAIKLGKNDNPGKLLKTWREAKGWSQQRLGEAVNLSQSAIYMFEKGRNRHIRKITAISKLTGIPAEHLEWDDEDTQSNKKKDEYRISKKDFEFLMKMKDVFSSQFHQYA